MAAIILPMAGFAIVKHLRTPQMLDRLMLAAIAIGAVIRFSMLTYHPDLTGLWTTLMVGVVFVIYLYLPLRLTGAFALALAFSAAAPLWWITHGAHVPPDVFYRGIVWLLLANALGFIAANSLQRGQRMQFAQSLLLRQLLSTDAMTGIANRRRFDIALEREWQRCRRAAAPMPMSLLMIDVDHFKAYNDHCGHPQGDACLRQVARILVDTVGRPGDIVARYGGEEFVCLLPNIGSAGALAVADKIAAALHYADIPHPRSPAGPRLTVSIGVATCKVFDGRPEAFVEHADKLLYVAKADGRNQIAVGQLPAAKPAALNVAMARTAA
jgi:diguanylate cyclase (GGDEF)-like protein